jgi:hypothetical protein
MTVAHRLVALAVAAAVTGLLAGPVSAAAAEASEAVLVRAVRARATAAYRGEQIVTDWESDGALVTVGHVEHDPPGWTRLEYRPLGSSRRWVVLRHRDTEIQYDPQALVGTRGSRPIEDEEAFLADRLPWLLANYQIIATPRQLLDRPTERVVLRPRQPDRPTRRLDIDASTGVILRSERDGPDGRLTQVTAFLSFQSMPSGWRANAALPPGLRLTERAPLRRVTPDQVRAAVGRVPVAVAVPEGFHRVADYLVGEPAPLIQTVYSDGLSVLVVSAQPGAMAQPPAGSRVITGAAGPLWMRRAGQQTLVHWTYDGWLLTMVGDLDPAALVGAAERTGVAAAPRVVDHFKAWLRGLRWPF